MMNDVGPSHYMDLVNLYGSPPALRAATSPVLVVAAGDELP